MLLAAGPMITEQPACISPPPNPLGGSAAKRARGAPDTTMMMGTSPGSGTAAPAPDGSLHAPALGDVGTAPQPSLNFWEVLVRPTGQAPGRQAGMSATPLFKALAIVTQRVAASKQDRHAASTEGLLQELTEAGGPLHVAGLQAADLQLHAAVAQEQEQEQEMSDGECAAQAAALAASSMALRDKCAALLLHPLLPELMEQYAEFVRVSAGCTQRAGLELHPRLQEAKRSKGKGFDGAVLH